MKKWLKRIGAMLLTLVMLATMLPVVSAAALSLSVDGLSASWSFIENKGGSATWTASGTQISVTAKGTTRNTNTSLLTLTNTLDCEAQLQFKYAFAPASVNNDNYLAIFNINNGEIEYKETASGEYTIMLAAGASLEITLKCARTATATTLKLSDITLIGATAQDPVLIFKPATEGGSYTLDGAAVTTEVVNEVALNTAVALEAQAAEGYNFLGWYDEMSAKYLSHVEFFNLIAAKDVIVRPIFVPDTVALFGVGDARYDDLADACAAATESDTNKVVVLLNDATLSGNYTIPAGVTLLIPYDDAHTSHGESPACTSVTGTQVPWIEPTAYRTLTLASGATITVNGALEVGGKHSAAGGTDGHYAAPSEFLGYIYMAPNSHIQVNNGGKLFAWGYVYGEGTVTAKDGAGIYEVFQVMDYRGGSATAAMQGVADIKVFPINQYYVQNVEVATTYEYGSTAYVVASIYSGATCVTSPAIQFIGDNAMFRPGKGSYIVKTYVAAEDKLLLEAYGDCTLAPMTVEAQGQNINTIDYPLPITSNLDIHIKSGIATLKQDVVMLPGSSLTVDQDATLHVDYTEVEMGTATLEPSDDYIKYGYNLTLMDRDHWTRGFSNHYDQEETGLNYTFHGNGLVPIRYSPSEHKVRTLADLEDARLNINGTVVSDGFIYSTVDYADPANGDYTVVGGGANVISSEGTGRVILNNGAGEELKFYMFDQAKNDQYMRENTGVEGLTVRFYYSYVTSLQLKNGNGTMLNTAETADGAAEYLYCQKHDHWYIGECTLPDLYEITWVANGETILISEVVPGMIPVYPDNAPVKALDNNYHYFFAGWAATEGGNVIDLPIAEASVTYYAVFTAEAHIYGTDTVDGKHSCECGKKASCFDADNDGDHLCDLNCGDTKSAHKGGTATCGAQAVCTECGQGYGDTPAHTYDNEYDADCNVCGNIREVPEKPSTGIVYGDVNGDGSIDMIDSALVQQHVNQWTVDMDLVAADVNCDGSVDMIDSALLQQYINQWDVTLGPV